ncbi:MAG: amidohydrolase family protein [Clostridiales bacterium]|jgi:imidazolonepropionase-like amidohydrolase|nr:amidohydrolase family protein [Clostridiales bacterium]
MLFRNALVHTGTETIPDCDIRIEEGKIAELGKGLEPKSGEASVDLSGKQVFPGFIDAGDYAGATDMAYEAKDFNENSNPVVPHLDIWHSIDPDELTRQELYMSGITSVAVSPGGNCVLGGTVAVVKTYGKNLHRMTVKRDAALKGSVTKEVSRVFGARWAKTRMAMIQLLKEALQQGNYEGSYRYRRTQEVIGSVLKGKIPLIIEAETAAEMESVMDALKDLVESGIRLAFVVAFQADRAGEAIKKANAQVILGEFTHYTSMMRNEANFAALVQLAKDGVPFSIALLSEDSICGRECYFWTAAKLRQGGVDEKLLLDMMCGNPARLFGVDDRIGALAPGLDADFVIFEGNPLTQVEARVLETFIEGRSVYKAGREE